jgi:hypothetical protein
MTHQLNQGQFLGLGPCTLPLSGSKVWNPCSQTANLPDRRLFSLVRPADGQLIGFMDYFDAGGTANYNGMLLSVQKRFSRGVAVIANYTWSHCIGDLTQGSGVNGGGVGYQNINDRRFDRGNCASQQIAGTFGADRRQIFNLTAVMESPRFSNTWMRTVATGWRLSPIFRAYSGGFVSITAGTDRALNGNSNQRANQVLPDPYCAVITPSCYLTPAAFAIPALGTLGNMGPYNVLTPGQWTLDATLSRLFRIHEALGLEIRGRGLQPHQHVSPRSSLGRGYRDVGPCHGCKRRQFRTDHKCARSKDHAGSGKVHLLIREQV